MRIRKLTDVRNDILLLIGQTALFICSIAFIIYIYQTNIEPDKRVAEDFTLSNCKIVDKHMSQEGRALHRYRADFRVEYITTNGPVSSVSSANGMDFSFTTNQAAQQEYLDEFEVGSVYSCWYDPLKNTTVVLVLRHSWYSTLPLFLPSLIAGIMLLYMIRSIVDLLEIYVIYKNKQQQRRK